MSPGYQCPLGDKHCADLDKALSTIGNAIRLAQDCVDCGLPFENELRQATELQRLVTNMKAKFFPNRV